MNIFLSKDELVTLTGRKQRNKQLKQLIAMNLPFYPDAFGWPKVLRSVVENAATQKNTPYPKTINLKKLTSFGGSHGA